MDEDQDKSVIFEDEASISVDDEEMNEEGKRERRNESDGKNKLQRVLYENNLMLFQLEQAEMIKESLRKENKLLKEAYNNHENEVVTNIQEKLKVKEEE